MYIDYYALLGFSNTEKYDHITSEQIEANYQKQKDQLEATLQKVTKDINKTYQERLEKKEKILEMLEQLKEAYEYCKEESSICLRNEILRINKESSNKSISRGPRTKDMNVGDVVKQTQFIPVKRTNKIDEKIISVSEEYAIISKDQLGYTDDNVRRCQIIIINDEEKQTGFLYKFYATNIVISKLIGDPDYRKIFLQSLEKQLMNSERIIYIGDIVTESDGKYTVINDMKQRQAIEKVNGFFEKLDEIKNKKENKEPEGEDR